MEQDHVLNIPLAPLPQPKRQFSPYYFFLIIPLTLLSYAVYPPKKPITPQGHADAPTIVRQSLATSDTPLAYYLAGSEKYLQEARSISQTTQNSQTDLDKRKIISLLNSSLQMANNGVTHYPSVAESYQQRARLLEVIATIDPSVKQAAENDRAIASRLKNQPVDTGRAVVTPTDIVEAAPLETASLLSQAVIALPKENLPQTVTEESSNALRGTVTLAAGTTDVKVRSNAISDDRLVYYTPEGDTNGEVLSLSSKSGSEHAFTLHLSGKLNHDLTINWWIVEE